ncbi:unnamed protein product [Triticum turgidum subsp. durum]|uniref:Uncharacterized protein n=1 Tax=Triticum turgidum subsp. durum TaxID=4567 RepID=A0A9R0SW61_TRITD|nr:unnamed protein product [Triticum turgidum subsp. durum]VAI02484.1 unnamed protein product [Triticum turgidum subsp. durum]
MRQGLGPIEVTFENFPYYLSENTKDVLLSCSFLHLEKKGFIEQFSEVSSINQRIYHLVHQDCNRRSRRTRPLSYVRPYPPWLLQGPYPPRFFRELF